MKKRNKAFSSFEVIISLTIVLMIVVIGWLVYQERNNKLAHQNGLRPNNSHVYKSSVGKANGTSYLKINQLGIELPLTSRLNGLYYFWDGSQAWILSPSLNKMAYSASSSMCQANPHNIGSSNSNSGTINFQYIGTISKSSGGNNGEVSAVTIHNQLYTFRAASSGCSSGQLVMNAINSLQLSLAKSLADAKSIN